MPRRRSLPRLTRASSIMLMYLVVGVLVIGQFLIARVLAWFYRVWDAVLTWFA